MGKCWIELAEDSDADVLLKLSGDKTPGFKGDEKEADQAGDKLREELVELQEHVKAKLAPFKYPRWIEFRTDLPKTATGKIQRFRLRAEDQS